MAKNPEALAHWNQLRGRWQAAHQDAVVARAALVNKQMACARGTGPDPTVKEIDYVERLEAVSTGLSIEMDEFVKSQLG